MNQIIFYFFYNLAHQSVVFDGLVIFLAVYFPYLVVALVAVFLLFHHDVLPSPNPLKELAIKWKEIFLVFFTGGLAWLVAQTLKLLIQAPRPFIALPQVSSLFPETGYAFPSQHTVFFFAVAWSVFAIHPRAGSVFMFLALLIGLARIVAGVHFPIDILGGVLVGFIVSSIATRFFKI